MLPDSCQSAEKTGYSFERDGYNFKARKLGQLIVTVIALLISCLFTLYKVTDSKGVLPGVLVSLSGESYRSNNVTQLNGSFTFTNLVPGQVLSKRRVFY